MRVEGDNGNWNNGANAGSRCVNLNNYPWNVNTNIGSRFACDLRLKAEMVFLRSATSDLYSQALNPCQDGRN